MRKKSSFRDWNLNKVIEHPEILGLKRGYAIYNGIKEKIKILFYRAPLHSTIVVQLGISVIGLFRYYNEKRFAFL